MREKVEQAINVLAGKIVQTVRADDALKYTQSALNMANVRSHLLASAESKQQETQQKPRRLSGPQIKTKGASN